MELRDYDRALNQAKARSLTPLIFKIRPSLSMVHTLPTCAAKHKKSGIPIDITGYASYLLCDGGVRIPIVGEW